MRERSLRLLLPVSTPLAGLVARKGFEKQSTKFIIKTTCQFSQRNVSQDNLLIS